MRTLITKETIVITCDICGMETDVIAKCLLCGKDICPRCNRCNQCIECWEDNCSFATIDSNTTEEGGYGGRSYTTTRLNHQSNEKWRDLISRFAGKRIKITIEEYPKHEEVILGVKPLVVKPIEGIDGCIKMFKSNNGQGMDE